MDPALIAKIQLAQAFAGDKRYNPKHWEAYFYLYWSTAFLSLFPPHSGVYIGPQYVLSTSQVTNDGVTKKTTRVPDFGLVYLKGTQTEFRPPPLIAEVRTKEELNFFFRGQYEVEDYSLLAICEVKGFPTIRKNLDGVELSEELDAHIDKVWLEAYAGARDQAKVFFSAHNDVEGIVAVACVGDYFSWARWDRRDVSELSKNVDGTYRPPPGLDALYSRPTIASRAKQVGASTMTLRSASARRQNPRYAASGSSQRANVSRGTVQNIASGSRRAENIASGSKGKGKAPEAPHGSKGKGKATEAPRTSRSTRATPPGSGDEGDPLPRPDTPLHFSGWSYEVRWLADDAEAEKDRLRAAIASYNQGRELF